MLSLMEVYSMADTTPLSPAALLNPCPINMTKQQIHFIRDCCVTILAFAAIGLSTN